MDGAQTGAGRSGKQTGEPHSFLWVYETPDSEAMWSEAGGDLRSSLGQGMLEMSDLDGAT